MTRKEHFRKEAKRSNCYCLCDDVFRQERDFLRGVVAGTHRLHWSQAIADLYEVCAELGHLTDFELVLSRMEAEIEETILSFDLVPVTMKRRRG